MSRFLLLLASTWVALPVAAEPGPAPGQSPAKSLEDLLHQIRQARSEEQKTNAEREAEFKSRRDQQAKLLADTLAKRAALEAQSKQLSAQYDANEKEIAQLNHMLTQRQGNLGELFGVTRQVAGDVATALSQSMISAQYQDREQFFRTIAGSKVLPSIAELERMWFEMVREMTETARSTRLVTKIAQADGSLAEREIVRIGPFIAMADGEYLAYRPTMKQFAVLPRQPPRHLTVTARKVQAAQNGYVRAAVDPSRGVLLALYVERPNLFERIQRGEFVGYVIITVGTIAALLALYQLLYLWRARRSVRRQLRHLDRPTANNPLGRVLLAFKGDPQRVEEEADVIELRISEAVLKEVPPLERFQSFLRLVVAAGPLLGLIGTVIGMIITFQAITESGSSDPKLMAGGIGQAMIATVLGLGIAIPLLFVNAGLQAMSRQLVQILEEQSTGLLADSLEKGARG